jgi:Zn-dependent protease with chaperone function
VVVPADIFQIERLTNNDPQNRGLTIPEYRQLLENDLKTDPIKDNDGAERQYPKLTASLTKEEMEAILQHEKGHGERGTSLRLAGITALTIPSLIGVDHVLMKKIGKYTQSLKKPILRSAAKLSVSALLGCLYHKYASPAPYFAASRYEEYKADDNVHKERIPAQISVLKKAQITREIIARELNKNGIKTPGLLKRIINPTYATHPTDAQRIARLQKRLRDQA